jgi:hypothetical protein
LLLTYNPTTLKYILTFITVVFTIQLQAQAVKVEVRQTPEGWEMLRDGKPYYVKGAGGDTHLAKPQKFKNRKFTFTPIRSTAIL